MGLVQKEKRTLNLRNGNSQVDQARYQMYYIHTSGKDKHKQESFLVPIFIFCLNSRYLSS